MNFTRFQRFHPLYCAAALAASLVAAETSARADPVENRPNVLFIAIDDLRNDLGVLGVAHASTPHLDRFARNGRLFSHHYTQVPTCGASRAALLSGRRPSRKVHLSNSAVQRTYEEWGDRSLPAWFGQHGYRTLSLGKISHHPGGLTGPGWAEGAQEMPGAWERAWVPESPWETPEAMMHGYANGKPRQRGESPLVEAHDGPDSAYADAWVAKEAIAVLEGLSREAEPWFFAVGFFKPHLPFAAPRSWWDIHNPDTIAVPPDQERRAAPSSYNSSGEMMGNYGGHHGRDPRRNAEYAKTLRHGYAAAVSYTDAQVGRVLDRVESLGLADNTIIVIWSDHGFNLGEYATWGKHSLYEDALKSPLILRYPGMPRPGETSAATVETVDVFPTLVHLSGLPRPEGLDGQSLLPQLLDPATASAKPAWGWWNQGQVTVRTRDWRLVARPNQADRAFELFDFREKASGARAAPEENPAVMAELMGHLEGLPTFD